MVRAVYSGHGAGRPGVSRLASPGVMPRDFTELRGPASSRLPEGLRDGSSQFAWLLITRRDGRAPPARRLPEATRA